MIVEFIRDRRRAKAGDKVELPDGVADVLRRRGFVRYVEIEEAVDDPIQRGAEMAVSRRPNVRRR